MIITYHDIETYSPVSITAGIGAYAEHPEAELLIWVYAVEDGDVQTWDVSQSPVMPDSLSEILNNQDALMLWHNGGGFDIPFLHYRGYNVPVHRCYDTRVLAYSCAMPGALADLCSVLGLPTDKSKDMAGKRLIKLFCVPHDGVRVLPSKYPAKWTEFRLYAAQDVVAMRECFKRLPKYNYNLGAGYNQWLDDYAINSTGIPIDVDTARTVLDTCEAVKKRINAGIYDETHGAVRTTQEVAAIIRYCANNGVFLRDLRAASVNDCLSTAIPDTVRKVLVARQATSRAPVAKFKRLIEGVNSDNRIRYTLQFRGAGRTGRSSGKIFQPHNLPREGFESLDDMHNAIITSGIDMLDLYEDPFATAVKLVRPIICAPEGKMLVVSDWSNIEGRVLAWLCGEKWVLDEFQLLDQGIGEDSYRVAYSRAFSVPLHSVTKDQRQIGKCLELACGYGGGAMAFAAFARVYGVDLDAMADVTWPTIPDAIQSETLDFLAWVKAKETFLTDMLDKTYMTCKALTTLWRNARPNTTAYWKQVGEAFQNAVESAEGNTFTAPSVMIDRKGQWVRIKLPSGRYLMYPHCRMEGKNIVFEGMNQTTHKWGDIYTHGGKLVENITQAVAADILFNAVGKLRKNGLNVVLHVHDEIMIEAAESEAEAVLDRLNAIMCDNSGWLTGLPLATKGETMQRYRK